MPMLFIHTILPWLLPLFILGTPDTLLLQQDMAQDLARLQGNSGYYISDNGSASPSLQTVAADLQLFAVAAGMDLSQATYTTNRQGNHQVDKWQFAAGEIRTIYQIRSTVHLDTVVTQQYLDNRPPTRQHITNNFTFRTYAVATASNPLKLYYLTEQDQGLLTYSIGERQVQLGYARKKEGLVDVLPQLEQEVNRLLKSTVN
ncbi:hypothetical protein [Pontibacter liquoris]|uniref:hypothetical protein n=1 Tax=Pontibacter liquoris TaxID=2905677 RepID=UPI001FA764C3|nr:hypothetical protein [Pontibacter liquoris]